MVYIKAVSSVTVAIPQSPPTTWRPSILGGKVGLAHQGGDGLEDDQEDAAAGSQSEHLGHEALVEGGQPIEG